jgi:hypothetical protein
MGKSTKKFHTQIGEKMNMKPTEIDPIIKVQELEEGSIDNEDKMNTAVQEYKDSDDDFGPF